MNAAAPLIRRVTAEKLVAGVARKADGDIASRELRYERNTAMTAANRIRNQLNVCCSPRNSSSRCIRRPIQASVGWLLSNAEISAEPSE